MRQILRLRRFLDARPSPREAPQCELCGAEIAPDHGHIADLENHRFLCACRPCVLLFQHPGAAGGKYRSASERCLRLPELAFDAALEAPVGISFFLRDSASNRVTGFYPSPAGPIESAIPLETWDDLVHANPALASMEPDIEALLILRSRGGEIENWIVPADACYELVGRIRRCWRGFDGGEDARREIGGFLRGLKEREQACGSPLVGSL